jgi:hypothetical protein
MQGRREYCEFVISLSPELAGKAGRAPASDDHLPHQAILQLKVDLTLL